MRDEYELIKSVGDLDKLLERSATEPVFLLKHSTVCPISVAGEAEFYRFAESVEEKVVCGFLDLRAHRDVSNEITTRLGVRHESPQAILVKDGAAVWNESHQGISAGSLAAALLANR